MFRSDKVRLIVLVLAILSPTALVGPPVRGEFHPVLARGIVEFSDADNNTSNGMLPYIDQKPSTYTAAREDFGEKEWRDGRSNEGPAIGSTNVLRIIAFRVQRQPPSDA